MTLRDGPTLHQRPGLKEEVLHSVPEPPPQLLELPELSFAPLAVQTCEEQLTVTKNGPNDHATLNYELSLGFFFFFISHMPSQAFITINLHELFFQTLCLDKRIIGFGL